MTAPPAHGVVPVAPPMHAFVLTMYIGLVVLGVCHTIGVIDSAAIRHCLPPVLAHAWAVLHLIAPLCALAGAVHAIHRQLPIRAMSYELVGLTVFALTKGTYAAALAATYGVSPGTGRAPTIILSVTIAAACAARAAQIGHDFRRLIRAAYTPGAPTSER